MILIPASSNRGDPEDLVIVTSETVPSLFRNE